MDAQTPFRTYDVGTKVVNVGTAAANQVAGGVFPGMGAMAVSTAGGMNIQVAAGYVCVPNSSSALQGGYIFGLMNAQTFTLTAASLSNPRIDIVVANVSDTGLPSAAAYVQVIAGTPAASPSVPTAPGNSITLGQVLVGAAVNSVTSANITDTRAYVVAPGGILPIATEAQAPALPASQFMYNIATNALVVGTGTAGVTGLPAILPWAPQIAVKTSNTLAASAGALTSVLSVTTPLMDGLTDIEIYLKWGGVQGSAQYITIGAYVDNVLADSVQVESLETTAHPTAGGSVHFYTSASQSGAGHTPSAATHTIAFQFQAGGTGTGTTDGIVATSTAVTLLRCAPVST